MQNGRLNPLGEPGAPCAVDVHLEAPAHGPAPRPVQMNFVSAWRDAGRRSVVIEPPLRDELLDLERLQDHARALAARFTVDRRRPRRRQRMLRGSRTTPALSAEAYRLLAGDVRARQFVLARRRVDARQLPPRRRPRSGRCARTCRGSYYAQLPALARAGHAGEVRVYAMAIELVRHSDSRLDRAAARRVPDQLSDRDAADHRRAVGVAEHAARWRCSRTCGGWPTR